MNAGTTTLVGLSLDEMPSEEDTSLFLKNADCSNVQAEDGNFYPCDNVPVYLNKKYLSFIYATRPLELGLISQESTQETLPSQSILSRLKNVLSAIASKWNQYFKNASPVRAYRGDPNYNTINKTLAFDKLYMSTVGGAAQRNVFGYYKKVGTTHHAVIRYSNFDNNVCEIVAGYKAANTDVFSTRDQMGNTVTPGSVQVAGIGCFEESPKNYVILMQGKPSGQAVFDYGRLQKAWEDFTVKLRVQ